MSKPTLKQRIYEALEDLPAAHGGARVFGVLLLVLIAANALLVGTDQISLSGTGFPWLFAFNAASTAVFALEYLLRLYIADMVYPGLPPARARARYALSLMGIIDLLSFLPMLLLFVSPYSAAVADAVRIIRLVRLVKITRYMRGLKTISVVFSKRQQEIVASFMVLALLCIASSVLMYEAEHAAQPDQFDSVLTGLYWSMTTMTSTGYGDLVPITPLGRLIGFITMALSIGVVAIPAGIFSAGFVAEFRRADRHDARVRAEDVEGVAGGASGWPHGKGAQGEVEHREDGGHEREGGSNG